MLARLIRGITTYCIEMVLAVLLVGGCFVITSYTSFNILLCIIANGVFVTVTLVAFFKISRLIEKKPNALTGHCLKCGYDLRGSIDRCPECGHEFQASESSCVHP